MKSTINLLPYENRRRLMLRVRIIQWMLLWCALGAIGVTFGWTRYLEHLAMEKELDTHTKNYAPIIELTNELSAMKKQAEAFAQQEKMAANLVDRHSLLTMLGVVAQSASQCHGRLHIHELRLGKSGEKGLGNTLESPIGASIVLIKGTSLDIASVTRFVDALRGANLFTQVDMKPTNETAIGNQLAFSYHVECSYQ